VKYPFPKNTLYVPLLLLVLIWTVFIFQLQGFGEYNCYGIVPRNLVGLRGIILSPLFHSGWKHIINNSIPLAVLSFFAVLVYQRVAYYVIIFGWVLTGFLTWVFGNLLSGDVSGCHIGASGIVYLLASYVFFSGVFKKSRNLIAVSLIVVFLYGSMIWGIFPEEFLPKFYKEDANPISWESHLSGGITGFVFAFVTRKYGVSRKIYSWEKSNGPDAREKWLWEKYKETLPDTERTELEKKYGENPDDGNEDYWFTNDSR
jgi:membrane associated rhomboid family serine protease